MTIKRVLILAAVLSGLAALGAQAGERGQAGNGGGAFRQAAPPVRQAAPPRQASFARQRVVINMGHPSSGYNHNFPIQQRAQSAPAARPSWGHVNWPSSGSQPGRSASPARSNQPAPAQTRSAWASRVPAGTFHPAPGMRMASVQHHHPYTLGYVRHKLSKLGVTTEPSLITDRSQIVHTDSAHSRISYPTRGPKGAALSAHQFDPRNTADAALVRTQMGRVNDPGWRANAESYNNIENRAGHYYWHRDNGFDYCHYLDSSGYQWYGWYLGDGFFWTRDFDNRWWWYDQANSRWDFYNDNFWWWQDPDHVGDLYCYNNGDYIPVNSAQDQIVVSEPDTSDFQAFTSPDGTRTVKLVAGGADAFLYDTATPPSFDPIYLASGVQSVQFSDTSNGRPLEIVLKLDDGSFDLFDAQGQVYSPGASDADAAAYSQSAPPDQGQAPAPADYGN